MPLWELVPPSENPRGIKCIIIEPDGLPILGKNAVGLGFLGNFAAGFVVC